MKALNLDQYDAVVVMSGDGLIHEVINGFAEHPQAREALRMPIAPIPSGSGNALAVNVLGPQDGYNVSAAALNVVKGMYIGRLMAMDLCAISQGGKSSFSFLSQAVGMFANLDLGTEHLRFLGSNRFVLGYIYEALRKKPCPVKLSMKLVDSDRKRMLRNLHERQSRARAQFALEHDPLNMGPTTGSSDETLSNESTVQLSKSPGSPPAMLSAEEDGWVTFNEPLLYMYAGNGPWVSREFMQFPVAVSDDGLIDIVVQDCTATRWMLLRAIDGAEKGHTYWMSTQHYFKVLAYRIEPYSKGHLSVDGERYPFMRIEVESHRGAARVLSPYGFWQAEFSAPEDGTK
ncbi:uncharacterized protein FIBRA_05450 [Fibroporia radiculosa]|uniref:DAGKc domain-containing protein n=1 Tax=Fibroporia radiculosa TaxID=599839 RepID=J4HXJ4_9APHY|nr:uncharacterized protein FIBRA_05450 [Fibroporia radiculosa]CCM03322.1 predicted protein [Fibroporia radiculosa]